MVAPWMLQLLIALTTSGVCGLTAATITTGGTKCSATPACRVESEATASTDAACGGGCGRTKAIRANAMQTIQIRLSFILYKCPLL